MPTSTQIQYFLYGYTITSKCFNPYQQDGKTLADALHVTRVYGYYDGEGNQLSEEQWKTIRFAKGNKAKKIEDIDELKKVEFGHIIKKIISSTESKQIAVVIKNKSGEVVSLGECAGDQGDEAADAFRKLNHWLNVGQDSLLPITVSDFRNGEATPEIVPYHNAELSSPVTEGHLMNCEAPPYFFDNRNNQAPDLSELKDWFKTSSTGQAIAALTESPNICSGGLFEHLNLGRNLGNINNDVIDQGNAVSQNGVFFWQNPYVMFPVLACELIALPLVVYWAVPQWFRGCFNSSTLNHYTPTDNFPRAYEINPLSPTGDRPPAYTVTGTPAPETPPPEYSQGPRTACPTDSPPTYLNTVLTDFQGPRYSANELASLAEEFSIHKLLDFMRNLVRGRGVEQRSPSGEIEFQPLNFPTSPNNAAPEASQPPPEPPTHVEIHIEQAYDDSQEVVGLVGNSLVFANIE